MATDRYVVSKLWGRRIACDGPLTAQIERCKLEQAMKAARVEPDVEVEYRRQPRKPARREPRSKQSTKQRYKTI